MFEQRSLYGRVRRVTDRGLQSRGSDPLAGLWLLAQNPVFFHACNTALAVQFYVSTSIMSGGDHFFTHELDKKRLHRPSLRLDRGVFHLA